MGSMIFIGGGEFRPDCVPMDRAMLGRLANQPPRVVIVPTAAANQAPVATAQAGVRHFDLLGAQATIALIVARADAANPAMAAALEAADLVYLTGGDPWYLLQTLRDTRCWQALFGVWKRGGVVAAAGGAAMALGDRMWWNNQWVPGLGLAPRVAILPGHHPAAEMEPGAGLGRLGMLVVIGIPVSTACASEYGNVWYVSGMGKAAVYTDQSAKLYAPGESFTLPEIVG